MSKTAIIDYGAGNLHSVVNSFRAVAGGDETIILTKSASDLRDADRVVLPGVGAYAHCKEGLEAQTGMIDAMNTFVKSGKPFLGICVGMQLLVESGLEHGIETAGLGWLKGEVKRIIPNSTAAKIPHMGWNNLHFAKPHPVFAGIAEGTDVYFVHSYSAQGMKNDDVIATTDYYGDITAAIGRDNILGTQFHPEKSQKTGLQILRNFLNWRP